MTSYTQNQTIIQAGDPFEDFHIITEGSVAAIYDSSESIKSFTLKKGDVIGIFDFIHNISLLFLRVSPSNSHKGNDSP